MNDDTFTLMTDEEIEEYTYDPFIRGYELGMTDEEIINQPGGPMAVFEDDYE